MVKVAAELHYDGARLLSYDCVWNFIIGARGLGKTFYAKRLGLRQFIRNGWEFVYLRRTDVEQHTKGTFFSDIASMFPDWEFRVNGTRGEAHHKAWKKDDWRVCCHFIALSQAGHLKSVAYPNVHLIVYDEVFPNNGRYLPEETKAFTEFQNTVDRWEDRVRVLFLSNAVSRANPYFAHYRIDLSAQEGRGQRFRTYARGYIGVELADYGGFAAKVAESRFGRFLIDNDPEYAEYAIGNKFTDDVTALVQPLDKTAHLAWTLDAGGQDGLFGMWANILENGDTQMTVSRRVPRDNDAPHFTLEPTHVTEDTILCVRSDDLLKRLCARYRSGRLWFDSGQAKADFTPVMGRLLGGGR